MYMHRRSVSSVSCVNTNWPCSWWDWKQAQAILLFSPGGGGKENNLDEMWKEWREEKKGKTDNECTGRDMIGPLRECPILRIWGVKQENCWRGKQLAKPPEPGGYICFCLVVQHCSVNHRDLQGIVNFPIMQGVHTFPSYGTCRPILYQLWGKEVVCHDFRYTPDFSFLWSSAIPRFQIGCGMETSMKEPTELPGRRIGRSRWEETNGTGAGWGSVYTTK